MVPEKFGKYHFQARMVNKNQDFNFLTAFRIYQIKKFTNFWHRLDEI